MPDLPPSKRSEAERRTLSGFAKLGRTLGDGSLRFHAREKAKATDGYQAPDVTGGSAPGAARYAELQVTSNFSFLRGASHPDELVVAAAALGHEAIAITDRNSFAGIVRAHQAANTVGIRLVVGVRLDLRDGTSLLAYPEDRAAYGRLTRLLTLGKRRAPKGECHLDYADVVDHGAGQIVVAMPPEAGDTAALAGLEAFAVRVAADFPGRTYLAAHHLYRGDDARRLACLAAVSARTGLPLLAVNDVLYHVPERRQLQDVVTCIREHCTIAEAGFRLLANAERHPKPAREMARLFYGYEGAVTRSLEIVERCRFSLKELQYEYPEEPVPEGMTPQEHLAALTWIGAVERFPDGFSDKVRHQIEHELALIKQLDYARYFLTVHDIVQYARSRDILCQGRGSAANSVVCYCLGITSISPDRIDVLFERFISAERKEPPDIDVDFEHERREEIIQHIYEKYGRDRAGLAATVICYRARGAIREVGKAMGLSGDVVAALAGIVWGWSNEGVADHRVREAGLDPGDRILRLTLDLAAELIGFPRHLSQHVGGFVMTRGPLSELVPIENAAMADRTVIEWDKDDLDALQILKVDVLALGMLTCVRKAFSLIDRHYGKSWTLASIPEEQPEVYEMLSRADSIGVFQVESRAQMTMLPRLKPAKFYDLVIEVAIVRPGPIQGDMVHPYLRRRSHKEKAEPLKPELAKILEKTEGVPLFQEQAMQIAITGAGFTPDEADQLRRSMATFKRNGDVHRFRDKFISGMVRNGYPEDFATRCFSQIEGFGTYGFPESHAASFALLVYVSAWIKCFHPDVFACALLNSQPMGFYAPAQIVRDAHVHGVEVRPVDVNHSEWDCTLEPIPGETRRHALRLGFRQIKGFAETDAEMLVGERGAGYPNIEALWRRSGLKRVVLERLADADALRSLVNVGRVGQQLDRRRALWALKALGEVPLPLFARADESMRSTEIPSEITAASLVPEMSLGEHVVEDYASLGLTLKRHPLAFLRAELAAEHLVTAVELATLPVNRRFAIAGLVLIRQRPGSANGVVFITVEDETGVANLIVWPDVLERFRRVALGATLLYCRGLLQREDEVIHIVAEDLRDLTPRLQTLRERSDTEQTSLTLLPSGELSRSVQHGFPPPRRIPGYDPREIVIPSRDFR